MKTLSDLLLYLLAAAFIQNFILTTGFGSSIMLRIVRRPKDILLFSGLLAGFSLLTVLIGYPCDMLMGTGQLAKLIRPVVMIAIAAVLYILTVVVLRRFLPAVFQRLSPLFLPAERGRRSAGRLSRVPRAGLADRRGDGAAGQPRYAAVLPRAPGDACVSRPAGARAARLFPERTAAVRPHPALTFFDER